MEVTVVQNTGNHPQDYTATHPEDILTAVTTHI
jgi:hypothetical protein